MHHDRRSLITRPSLPLATPTPALLALALALPLAGCQAPDGAEPGQGVPGGPSAQPEPIASPTQAGPALDGGAPTSSAGVLGDTSAWGAPADRALAEINGVRLSLGLSPVAPHGALAAAAQAHADFLALHRDYYEDKQLSAHVQVPGLPGFTGESFTDRAEAAGYDGAAYGEVVAFRPSAEAATGAWLASVYHRLPLLEPHIEEVGYGEAQGEIVRANVLEFGLRDPGLVTHEAASGPTVLFPAPGAVDVPTSWDGNEVPQPAAPPAGYPSGPVLTAQFPSGPVTVMAVEVRGGDGTLHPATVLSRVNDTAMPPNAVAVLPYEPLEPLTSYEVTLVADVAGAAVHERWTFTTRRAGCDPVAQDCGPGMGCYVGEQGPTCLWHGDIASGETCTWTNDCRPGETCYGSRCRPICQMGAASADDMGCDAACLEGTGPLGTSKDHGVCLAPSCMQAETGCGEGEGCYWAGSFLCHWAGSGQVGEPCAYLNDCASGLGCLGWDGVYRCRTFCDGPDQAACDTLCPGDSVLVDEATGVSFCK